MDIIKKEFDNSFLNTKLFYSLCQFILWPRLPPLNL